MSSNSDKTKVGMVQINNSFSRQSYLPLSLGFLHSYAKKYVENFDDFEFSIPVYKRIPVDDAVDQLSGSDIACFSTYVWNFELSCEIARRLKEKKPETIIAFGGCHVPDTKEKGLEKFLRDRPFIDMASTGEGELVFKAILDNHEDRNWFQIPSTAYLNEKGDFIHTPKAPRIEDLNTIPSPFLSGYFDELMEANPEENWIGLYETDRGCPFACTFCDWGTGEKNRMSDYDLETRIYPEIDWFSENKIEFVFCCNANFGIYSTKRFDFRDRKIAERFATNKEKYGYPHRFSVQNTKNSTDASYEIQKILVDSGLDKGVLLAFQSTHEPTLEAIKRKNIKLETFFELQRRFTKDGVATFSDIILGLPEETYDTFVNGVSDLMQRGQHNRIQFNNLSVLPNAPMMDDVEKYGIEMVESKLINIHGSLEETEEIQEIQQLVVGNKTMPREDWAKARAFGYMTAFVHFDKLLQIPNIVMNTNYNVPYGEIVDTFIGADPKESPIIAETSKFFIDKARDMQNGGAEFCESKKWLNIWWPADELAYINLATEGRLPQFYEEAERTLDGLIRKYGGENHQNILSEAITFNRALLKQPFNNEDKTVDLKYNIWDVYQLGLLGENAAIQEGEYSHTIDRTTDKWDSWEDWCERVVWWGNKKGDYLYKLQTVPVPVA